MRGVIIALTIAPFVWGAGQAEAQDRAAAARVVDEGMNHSEALTIAHELADGIGSRLTNSPGARAAENWAQRRFREWGLSNVRAEGFDFGRGWSIDSISVRMVEPRPLALRAIPIAWTPATQGPLSGTIFVAPIEKERDLAQWRGKLRGKIVLVDLPTAGSEPTEPVFRRLDSADIAKLDQFPLPVHGPDKPPAWLVTLQLQEKIDAFLASEGAVARVRQARADGGLLFGEGYQHERGAALPAVELAAEDYRRLTRLAKAGPVTLEIDSRVRFHDDDHRAYNIFADVPGSEPRSGFVMAGAHLDSWVGGDGAVDNGAGVTIVMEAARILARLGVRPKRTIRFVLWGAEEQGLIGSIAYIDRNLASRPPAPPGSDAVTRYYRRPLSFPITKLADYDRLAGYFNLDNGSGKIRGIYGEGNLSAVPILETLIAPYRSLGVERVVAGKTGGTDHVPMADVGLPAFQFIQDPLDYKSRVHHSNIDTFDHLKRDDLRQAAVVLAGVLFGVANLPQPLPRTPLPTTPSPTDPYEYPPSDD